MSGRAANPVIAQLQGRIAHLETGVGRARKVLPFGVADIDRRLPGGGLGLGCLHEVAGGGNGALDGAAAALFAAGIATRTKGKVLWIPGNWQRGLASSVGPSMLGKSSREPFSQ